MPDAHVPERTGLESIGHLGEGKTDAEGSGLHLRILEVTKLRQNLPQFLDPLENGKLAVSWRSDKGAQMVKPPTGDGDACRKAVAGQGGICRNMEKGFIPVKR